MQNNEHFQTFRKVDFSDGNVFLAQRVILGKTEFDAVPKALKKQVAEILIDSGLPEMYGRVRRREK